MSRWKRHQALIFLAILVGSVGCDHAIKHIARTALEASHTISLVGDAVRFELVVNPGGFLSLGAELPAWLRDVTFLVLIPVVLACVCGAFLRSGIVWPHQLVGLGLVAGGGVANWLDRLLHSGAVTDFVSLGLGSLRTGIFNVADLTIILGVALLAIGGRRDAGSEANDAEAG